MEEPESVYLMPDNHWSYWANQSYQNNKDIIHFTEFDEGTVTLIKRHFHTDVDHAHVYWPEGAEWGMLNQDLPHQKKC